MQDFQRLLKYLRPYWWTFTLAVIAMLLAAAFESALGGLVVPLIDRFQNSDNSQAASTIFGLQDLIPQDDWYRAWLTLSGLMIAFTIGSGIADFFSAYLMAKIGQSAVLELRRELYEHIQRQSAVFYERHRTNYLVTRLVTSANAIENAVSLNMRDILRESIMLISCLAGAAYFNWRLTVGALIIVPILSFFTTKISRSLRKFSEQSFEGNKYLTDAAQESLSNHTIVKAYRAEKFEKERFVDVARSIAKANRRSVRVASLSSPVISLFGVIMIAGLLFFGLREINVGNMEASQFFGFLLFLFRSYDPMRRLSRQHNDVNRALAAIRDIWSVLDESEVLPEKPDAVKLVAPQNKIELENVSFRYQNSEKAILKNINLEIPRGQMVALVGESGGGKSTLIKLIQRLYDPTEGRVLWDAVDLRDADLSSLKSQIALVTQETVLFNNTVRYNIAYGRQNATDQEIREAARVAFADNFIEELPDGYDTLVGERGIFLSGGQRQRLAIARAVLVNAPVLILDEATSALDTESEALVQEALTNLMRNRTSVVIAHRLSTIRRADKIVVMEKGAIIESGTHAELLKKGGTYRRLYELQFLQDEIKSPVSSRKT